MVGWLDQVMVDARFARASSVIILAVTGDRDNDEGLGTHLPEPGGNPIAVQAGQAEIEQHIGEFPTKVSMNMEQSLGLCSQLRISGFTLSVLLIRSNMNDYAATSTSSQLHNDLRTEFAVVSLEYFPSLRAAVGSLRARGQVP
jgi:hypothetical protein